MVASATTAVLMLASLTAAEEHAADDAAVVMREPPAIRQRIGGDHLVTTHIVTVNAVSDECRCAAQSMPALNALSLRSDVGGGGIGSDVRARDQRKHRTQCPHGSMRTLDRESNSWDGLARSGRTPCRSGRRALRESADVARTSTGLHTAVEPLYITLAL